MNEQHSARPPGPSDAELREFGYAPGSYMSKCMDCEAEIWHVDKRCHVCRPCAVKRFHKPRELLSTEYQLSDWDLCDEHETTFPRGDVCPGCVADLDDSPLKDSDEEADQW